MSRREKMTFKLITQWRTLFLKINWTERLLSMENKAVDLLARSKVREEVREDVIKSGY